VGVEVVMWKLMLTAGIFLGLSACATPSSKNERPATFTGPDNVVDTEKIDKVTQWAHDHGAKLIWIRYPVRANLRPTPAGGD
jgi:hypothetical protein